jgi:hypothetical protein
VPKTLDLYMPYDSGAGANVTEDGWRSFMRNILPSGVLPGAPDNKFAVYADSTGMQVKAKTGSAWIEGNWGSSTTEKPLPIAASHATLGRLDLAVLRNRFADNYIELDVLPGTPASTPAYPPLTQNTSIWEIPLAQVIVDPTVTTIAAAKVIDFRQYNRPFARYYAATTGVSYTAGNTFAQTYDTPTDICSDVIPNGNGSQFTLSRGGVWYVQGSVRAQYTYTGGAEQGFYWFVAKNGSLVTELQGRTIEPLVLTNQFFVAEISTTARFAAGDTVQFNLRNNSTHTATATPAAQAIACNFRWLDY